MVPWVLEAGEPEEGDEGIAGTESEDGGAGESGAAGDADVSGLRQDVPVEWAVEPVSQAMLRAEGGRTDGEDG